MIKFLSSDALANLAALAGVFLAYLAFRHTKRVDALSRASDLRVAVRELDGFKASARWRDLRDRLEAELSAGRTEVDRALVRLPLDDREDVARFARDYARVIFQDASALHHDEIARKFDLASRHPALLAEMNRAGGEPLLDSLQAKVRRSLGLAAKLHGVMPVTVEELSALLADANALACASDDPTLPNKAKEWDRYLRALRAAAELQLGEVECAPGGNLDEFRLLQIIKALAVLQYLYACGEGLALED